MRPTRPEWRPNTPFRTTLSQCDTPSVTRRRSEGDRKSESLAAEKPERREEGLRAESKTARGISFRKDRGLAIPRARALCAKKANRDNHQFIIGTCTLTDTNEIVELEYLENSDSVVQKATYDHKYQVFGIETSPQEENLVITSWLSSMNAHGLTLWKLPPPTQSPESNSGTTSFKDSHKQPLEAVSDLSTDNELFSIAKWHPVKDSILVSNSKALSAWVIADTDVKMSSSSVYQEDDKSSTHLFTAAPVAAWDPHSGAVSAVALNGHINLYDTRKMNRTAARVAEAHLGVVRDLDFNPNKPSTLVSCGDDRLIKFWDLRHSSRPLRILEGHSQRVWTARYNPFHDQLILSGGSDYIVSLWRVASCSSAPWLSGDVTSGDTDLASRPYDPLAEDDADYNLSGGNDPADVKVRHIDQHEDVVHSVAWSATDAWVYCSLSYDARVIINHVPSTEKYKILL